jgi:outer membrane protein TolC
MNVKVMPAAVAIAIVWLVTLVPAVSYGAELTLDQALDRALQNTARGGMIRGNLEVAQQQYFARRVNLYVPEISINGSLPTYSTAEDYQSYRNNFDRQLVKTTDLNFNSFIELNQSLVTGGKLTATANLTRKNYRYPMEYSTELDDSTTFVSRYFLDEYTKRGYFNFSLEQPLFRPSEVKYQLNNRKDELTIAEMTRVEQEAALKKEVIEAYLKVLQTDVRLEKTTADLRKATLKATIDSTKLGDGVISQEDYLLSVSAKLDAQLAHSEVLTEAETLRRELTTLLDLDMNAELDLREPQVLQTVDSAESRRIIEAWESTVPIVKAEHQYQKAKREAEYSAAGQRLTGDLRATYSFGRGNVEKERFYGTTKEAIRTNGWTVSLDFRLPIWDGGAAGATIKASQYQAEQARYEFTRAQRSARAQIVNLINQLSVSHQRMAIKRQQIDLAKSRLEIAESRFADGQISELTLLESRVFYLDSRYNYIEELKTYLLNKIELDGKFSA